jgi:drug/metabolite transporter (DMT)-like permease
MPAPSKPLFVVAFLLLCLIWGTTWLVIQIGLQGVPPFSGVALRFALAALVLLALARIRGVRLGTRPREKRLWVINGLFSFLISYCVVYWSEQWVPSGLAAVLFATYPLFVALIGSFALQSERLTLRELVSILIGFGGVGLIFGEDFAALGGAQVRVASAVMLLSPLAAAIGSVSVKRWGAGIHPFSLTAVPMAMTAGAAGVVAAIVEREQDFDWNVTSAGAVLYLAVVGSAVTFSLYYWLLQHLPVQRLALVAYVIPIVAVFLGVLRGEPLTTRILLGTAVVISGVALAVHRRG